MSKSETQDTDFLEKLKLNYKQRIQEADAFSKHFSANSADFRSEYLSGLLDIFQYYVDLQKKFAKTYPKWYNNNLMVQQSKVITEVWIQTFRNMDLFYSQFLDYTRKNIRVANQTIIQVMQTAERFYDMYEYTNPTQRNILIELIKQAKKYNDSLEEKQKNKLQSQNKSQKSQVISKNPNLK